MPISEVNSRRTREKHSADSKKGGKKSGESRREKKTIQKILDDFLSQQIKDNKSMTTVAEKLGVKNDETIKHLVTVACTLNTLQKGNFEDLGKLVKLLGETSEKDMSELDAVLKKIEGNI